ncbi:MAG: hypothetical protein IPM57_05340 [Oligoflexia bacterium]|nr:hypothetical protein [Oligoflexia bacterium]
MGLVFSILLAVTVFGADSSVNKALHDTQEKLDSENNSVKLAKPSPIKKVSPQPVSPDFVDVTPLSPEEQFNLESRPRGSHVKVVDPEEPIKEEIKQEQDYEKYKSNYKKAVIKEVKRLQEN